MQKMPLEDHLADLRRTVIYILFYLVAAFTLCFTFSDQIQAILLKPMVEALNKTRGGEMVFLGILDKVMTSLQVSMWASLIIAAPLWFFEIWRFIRPALTPTEAQVVRPFMLVGFLLFSLGVLFGYFCVFPAIFDVLLNYGVLENVKAQIALREYLSLVLKLLLGLGIIFQIPNVMLILGFMGLVTQQSLKAMRPYVYIGMSILAALFTPPDVFTQLAALIPMVILFEVGVLAVRFIVHPYLLRKNA